MKFYEKPHIYINNDKEQYRSVTGITKLLEPKKDWDKIAEKYAKKNNLKVEDVKAKWEHEKKIAAERGNKYHSSQEAKDLSLPFAVVMSSDVIKTLEVFPSHIDNGVKIGGSLKLKPGIYPELMVWLDSIKIAGQIDRPEITEDTVNIIDYKTNKKIDLKAWSSKWQPAEKLLYPCNHLDNCNFNLYSIQLNFYAYIVMRHNPNLKLGKLIIRHVLYEEGNDVPIGTKDYIVPDMQKEIRNIVQAIKNKKL